MRREADLAVRPSRFEHQEVVETAVAALHFGLYGSDVYLAEHGIPDLYTLTNVTTSTRF